MKKNLINSCSKLTKTECNDNDSLIQSGRVRGGIFKEKRDEYHTRNRKNKNF